jgi:hypothetical protein
VYSEDVPSLGDTPDDVLNAAPVLYDLEGIMFQDTDIVNLSAI